MFMQVLGMLFRDVCVVKVVLGLSSRWIKQLGACMPLQFVVIDGCVDCKGRK